MSSNPGWLDRLRARVQEAGRLAIIGQAAAALRDYLTEQGWSPQELADRVDQGPDWVLEALGRLPPDEMARARWAFATVAAALTEQDFWEILKHDALHERHHAHVLLLVDPARWPRVVAAFRAAQAWLAQGAGNPPPSA